MNNFGKRAKDANLNYLGLANVAAAYWNLTPAELVEETILSQTGTLTDTGALAIETGEFTGRSPKDRFIVKDELTADKVWWGDINIPFESQKFDALYNRVTAYLAGKEVYVRDAFAGADERYKLNVRIVTEQPWSNLFASNMFIEPKADEIDAFSPQWHVINAPGFLADPAIDGTRQHNFAIINFTRKCIIVGGSGYTGEIKKGIFSVLNFILPTEKNVLPMHCSANIGENNDTAIFFGLSGTGKTTLSSDPNRKLIGDDEHGWSDNSVFNFEGGCYAKTIDLSAEKEPQIYRAIKFGALLENIVFNEDGSSVDYSDGSKTENTRVSYPLNHIENAVFPSVGSEPKHIFFLTCDAYGVLPPISKLTKAQAMFHFMSGYTAKVAGTEAGITEPTTAFSACFGAPFMPLHPSRYAEMLGTKLDKNENVKVWLINTGWSGGAYGQGERIKLKFTRAMITAALEGQLNHVNYHTHGIFGLEMPETCPGVPTEILDPKNTWTDKNAYDEKAQVLAEKFVNNFKKFEAETHPEILSAAPKVGAKA